MVTLLPEIYAPKRFSAAFQLRTSQIALKYSALRFWYWRLQIDPLDLLFLSEKLRNGQNLLVSVLPGIDTEKRGVLTNDRVLVLFIQSAFILIHECWTQLELTA